MRENEKEREELKASRPKSFIDEQKVSGYSVCLGLYSAQNNINYQNEQKQLTIAGTKWEEIKRGTKVKRRRKWQICSVAKFRNL